VDRREVLVAQRTAIFNRLRPRRGVSDWWFTAF
jgi:hypothetical protein